MRKLKVSIADLLAIVAAFALVAGLFLTISGCTPPGYVRAGPYADAYRNLKPYADSAIVADSSASDLKRRALLQQSDFLLDGLMEGKQRGEGN